MWPDYVNCVLLSNGVSFHSTGLGLQTGLVNAYDLMFIHVMEDTWSFPKIQNI